MTPAGSIEREPRMTTATDKTTEPKSLPVDTWRVGFLSAAIWQREAKDSAYYSVSFERSYKDAQGNWQTTSNLDYEDLMNVSKMAEQAFDKITALRAKSRPANAA